MNKHGVRVTLLGAARCVTGSKYLIESDKKNILVDCGLFQGKKSLRQRNWKDLDFDVSKLDAVILTHAHIDHTGYLPRLVKLGYKGPVYTTPASIELLRLLLPDSARLNQEQAKYLNKNSLSKHKPPKPLYSLPDAYEALKMLRPIEKNNWNQVFESVSVYPVCAGHILGSTALNVDIYGRCITFSGDIGRYGAPILADPVGLELGDLLFCESTYGNKTHKNSYIEEGLTNAINWSIDNRSPLLIPAFSIGRTQNLLYLVSKLEREGKIPVCPVFVDTPMGVNATNIYKKYRHDYDEDAKDIIDAGDLPLQSEQTFLIGGVRESKELNYLKGPRIIISASGMVTGGRILHHMKRWLPKEDTQVLFVGYQAEGTRGRDIKEGKDVKIFGSHVSNNARVSFISGLSAHGDQNELLQWIKSCSGSPLVVKTIHGESRVVDEFASLIQKRFGYRSSAGEMGEVVEL